MDLDQIVSQLATAFALNPAGFERERDLILQPLSPQQRSAVMDRARQAVVAEAHRRQRDGELMERFAGVPRSGFIWPAWLRRDPDKA